MPRRPIDSARDLPHHADMTCLASRMEKARQLVGMLHVPITSLLAAPRAWLDRLGLPVPSPHDAQLVVDLERGSDPVVGLRGLSFLRFLEDRAMAEAECYARHGLTAMQLENVGAPYSIGRGISVVETVVMDHLAGLVRTRLPNASLGLQILSAGGEQALQIALARGLDYLRVEGVLFEGVRPEGRLANSGGLHALYAQRRKQLLLRQGADTGRPRIFVDLLKKHTVFPPEMQRLDLWLHQIVFMKLEGVIVTGPETGSPADEASLAAAGEVVSKVRGEVGLFVPLLAGSGVTSENIAMYARHVHGVIAGSFLKKNGHWENSVDEDRVAKLAAAAARAGFEIG